MLHENLFKSEYQSRSLRIDQSTIVAPVTDSLAKRMCYLGALTSRDIFKLFIVIARTLPRTKME